jgi:hypothetical protein
MVDLSGIRCSLKECFVNWISKYQIPYNRIFLNALNNYQIFEKRHTCIVELAERMQVVVQSHFKDPEI